MWRQKKLHYCPLHWAAAHDAYDCVRALLKLKANVNQQVPVSRLVGYVIGWLCGWLCGWLVMWLVGYVVGWLVDWLCGLVDH